MKRTAPEICPACGAEVPPRALACPECGADENTGWNEEATRYDGLDLPGEDIDKEEAGHFEGKLARLRPKGISLGWWLLAIVLLALLASAILTGQW